MSIFAYLALFLLIRRLQKPLTFSPLRTKWMSVFTFGSWGLIGVYILAEACFRDEVNEILGGSLLLAAVIYADKEPDLNLFRSFIKAHFPLAGTTILAGLVELISDTFYDKYDNYFVFAIIGSFIWIFARWATTKKQRDEFNFITMQNKHLDKLVAERTAELTEQKNALQETIKELNATQAQLIQSEKMASLGELTAGIAHEIQNPLNFVNNFSEVSMELLEEMGQELDKGDTEEAKAIAEDVRQNLEKIRHHGQRADGIVKGMLQHSRASSGQKELTDLNTLADEYLRLAYHGLRAKDKSFNSELITHYDEKLPKTSVVPQDIGRVMLNLFTNAFYAVQEKQKTAGADYKPTVEVSTLLKGKSMEIRVKDNGTGIPESIKEKIMQPFFTTKPTGQGTGLGLSMSYDIVVKAHGGKIDVKSTAGEGSEFIIILPFLNT